MFLTAQWMECLEQNWLMPASPYQSSSCFHCSKEHGFFQWFGFLVEQAAKTKATEAPSNIINRLQRLFLSLVKRSTIKMSGKWSIERRGKGNSVSSISFDCWNEAKIRTILKDYWKMQMNSFSSQKIIILKNRII